MSRAVDLRAKRRAARYLSPKMSHPEMKRFWELSKQQAAVEEANMRTLLKKRERRKQQARSAALGTGPRPSAEEVPDVSQDDALWRLAATDAAVTGAVSDAAASAAVEKVAAAADDSRRLGAGSACWAVWAARSGASAAAPAQHRSALHSAAFNGQVAVVKALLAKGVDPDFVVYSCLGQTPLHDAALGGSFPAVRELLDAGADQWRQDSHGDTPLHVAARTGFVHVARLLASHPSARRDGKRVAALRNHAGRTAAELAQLKALRVVLAPAAVRRRASSASHKVASSGPRRAPAADACGPSRRSGTALSVRRKNAGPSVSPHRAVVGRRRPGTASNRRRRPASSLL